MMGCESHRESASVVERRYSCKHAATHLYQRHRDARGRQLRAQRVGGRLDGVLRRGVGAVAGEGDFAWGGRVGVGLDVYGSLSRSG